MLPYLPRAHTVDQPRPSVTVLLLRNCDAFPLQNFFPHALHHG
jgi:hypothetical protein